MNKQEYYTTRNQLVKGLASLEKKLVEARKSQTEQMRRLSNTLAIEGTRREWDKKIQFLVDEKRRIIEEMNKLARPRI